MILFSLAAAGVLLYGAAYAGFCIKKGGIPAALAICCLLLSDLGLLALLLYYRTHT